LIGETNWRITNALKRPDAAPKPTSMRAGRKGIGGGRRPLPRREKRGNTTLAKGKKGDNKC